MAIISWKHKGLEAFFWTGSTHGIQAKHEDKLRRALSLLNQASHVDEMRLPAYRLHQLNPKSEKIWAISINGNWRVTFRFKNENAEIVDYLDYH
jgi:toxin HigB-1